MTVEIGLNKELQQLYVFYVGILLIKVLLMSLLVGVYRVIFRTLPSSEDTKYLKGSTTIPNVNVERVRRAHLNDLENIPFFIVGSYLYLLTNPSVFAATWILRSYTLARIGHTIGYVLLRSSVIRIVGYEIGWCLNLFVAIKTVANAI